MIDPRVLEAADAFVTRMRGQLGGEIDRRKMTEPEQKTWLDAARETYKQLFGELTARAHWDLVATSSGIEMLPDDHPWVKETTITFLTAEHAARLREQLNKRKA